MGAYPLATLAEFVGATRLREAAGKGGGPREMLQELLADHETMARQLRTDVGACEAKHDDVGTADFLTALLEEHEKMAWMLRAYLEEGAR
jgi:starvation-inducible DNA-binding protein